MNQDLLMLLLSPTQPRRIRTIENLLTKNKTPSTLLFGMLYGLLGYYGLFNRIDSDKTDRNLHELIKADLVQVVGNTQPQYLLTAAGATRVHNIVNQFELPINVGHNQNYDLLQFRRQFLFAVQAVSEFSYQNANYSPMFNDIDDQSKVKQWFYKYKAPHLASQFKQLLNNFLTTLPTTNAQLFATGLNGHQVTGLTTGQLAIEFKLVPSLMELFDLSLFNQLITFLLAHRNQYPAICGLVDNAKRSLISNAALSTYHDYMNQSTHSLNLLAKQHNYKLSTVKDHLYEVATLLPLASVELTQFVPESTINKINSIYHGDVNEWKYDGSLAKQYQFSFFDYRMVQIFRGKL